MKVSETLLILVLILFYFYGYLNAVYVVESRMKRSTAKRPGNIKGALTKTNIELKLKNNSTCNGSICTSSSRDPTSPERNTTIIQNIFNSLSKTPLLCLAYGQTGLDVKLVSYDPYKQICCNGLFNRTSSEEQCCNGYIINGETELCCGDRRIPKSKSSGCCKDTIYVKNTTICCNGTLFPRTKYSECCGDRVISAISEICCTGRTFTKTFGNDSCCGNVSYDPSSSVCCEGVVQPLKGERNGNGSCCGNVSYDSRCFTCTVSKVLMSIGNNTINDTCCDGEIKNYKGRLVCCENGTDYRLCPWYKVYPDGTLEHVVTKTPTNLDHTLIIIGCVVTSFSVIGLVVFLLYKRQFMKECLRQIQYRNSRPKDDPIESQSNLLQHEENPDTSTEIAKGDKPFKTQMDETRSFGSSRHNVSMCVQDIDCEEGSPTDDDDDNRDVNQLFNDNSLNMGDIMEALRKDKTPQSGNELIDHFKDIGCQTTSKDKPCNRRTVLGGEFEHSDILDLKQPFFEMPQSEVRVRLPDSLLKQCPVEMHGTSFGNLTTVHNKITINTGDQVASPVVEYLLTGVTEMGDYAVVTMPFVGRETDLKIWKFHSDDGMQAKVEPFEVPRKTKENTDQALFYVIEGNSVKIYTRSFSGFFITKEKHNRDKCLSLESFLFGSYKRFPSNRYEIQLMLYIADELMIYKDYSKHMYKIEGTEGRQLLKNRPLKLTDEVREDDILKAMVCVEGDHWIHKIHPVKKIPVHAEIKHIKFRELVQQCPDCPNCHFQRKNTVPYSVEWYLTNRSDVIPSDVFKCMVDVDCIKTGTEGTEVCEANCIVVDELQLRPEDRLPQMESNEVVRLEQLNRFLTNMEDECKMKFVENIKRKYDCHGDQISEVLLNLHRTMKIVGIYETVVNTLQLGQMYAQLSSLQNKGILEDKYFPKPVQRTGVDDSEQSQRRESSRSNAHVQGRSALRSDDQPVDHATGPSTAVAESPIVNVEDNIAASKTLCLNRPHPNTNYSEYHKADDKNLRKGKRDDVGKNLMALKPNNQRDRPHALVTHAYSNSRTVDEPQNSGAYGTDVITDTECRNELGSDLPTCSYDRTNQSAGVIHSRPVDRARMDNASGLAGDHDHRLPENAENMNLLELTDVKHVLPVQEHASLEETFLKGASESDSEQE